MGECGGKKGRTDKMQIYYISFSFLLTLPSVQHGTKRFCVEPMNKSLSHQMCVRTFR